MKAEHARSIQEINNKISSMQSQIEKIEAISF